MQHPKKPRILLNREHISGNDVLTREILTVDVWNEVFDLFKKHFSTEMPFIPAHIFRPRMRDVVRQKFINSTTKDDRLIFLGVLTLAARFHDALVYHYSPASSPEHRNPLKASDYYYGALKAAVDLELKEVAKPFLELIQALLMLGYYEWERGMGLSASIHITKAIRMADSMHLRFEDGPEIQPLTCLLREKRMMAEPSNAAEKEVRRRTFWSCFIMDRMISSGKYRSTMISFSKAQVQLPCSANQFLHVSSRTRNELRVVDVLSKFVELIHIWGEICEWCYAGGRRTEKNPPWDPNTDFFKLRLQLERFQSSLPSHFTYTDSNLDTFFCTDRSMTYTSLHMLYFLCLIMIHREYVPFIPLRCTKPQGPLDEPTFAKDSAPDKFWEDSAKEMFGAAKNILDIARKCLEERMLPKSTLIVFSIWAATLVAIYSASFPHMDMLSHLRDYKLGKRSESYLNLAVEALENLAPTVQSAHGYLQLVRWVQNYFQGVREVALVGGGLDEYKRCERELYDFGRLDDCGMHVPLSKFDIPSKQIDSQVGESESTMDGEPDDETSEDSDESGGVPLYNQPSSSPKASQSMDAGFGSMEVDTQFPTHAQYPTHAECPLYNQYPVGNLYSPAGFDSAFNVVGIDYYLDYGPTYAGAPAEYGWNWDGIWRGGDLAER